VSYDEIDDIFGGGGGKGVPSYSPKKPGESITGLIYKMEKKNETDDDNNIVYYDNSETPKPLFVAHLLTDMRDPEIEGDDGSRRVWMKGNALWALKQFLKANEIKKPEIGGWLKLQVDSLRPPTNPKRKPMKEHSAAYRKGTEDDLSRALAHARKKEEEFKASRAEEDDFFGDSGAKADTGKPKTTLDSMRGTGRSAGFTDEPPF
jgi:hypothetical protein